jgi:erythronate-4-phosphate dehydrogenase
VVEYVLAALVALERPWDRLETGGALGIVGFGHVGRRLHTLARDLGWRVLVNDPLVQEAGTPGCTQDDVHFASLDEMLGCCDVISLHCSLHSVSPWPSRHLIDEAALAKLGAQQYLINASRGEVVDNAALLLRLRQSDAPQVVLDVWEDEPGFDRRFLDMESLLIATPHIAGYSWDAKWAATSMLARATFNLGEDALSSPSLSAPLLDGASADSPLELVRCLMAQRYDVLADDRRFREIATLESNEARAAGFDALRRNYPVRRELRGSIAQGSAGASRVAGQDRRLLKALGILERETGFEPATSTLARLRSTN